MQYKKLTFLVMGLLLVSLILAACGTASSAQSNFPTGEFVLPDNRFEGVYFGENGTWYGFFCR